MPDTETQTTVSQEADEEEEEDESQNRIKVLLAIALFSCFLNAGNSFALDSILSSTFHNSSSNVTQLPSPAVESLFSLLPALLSVFLPIVAGCLLDMTSLGRVLLVFSLLCAVGTIIKMMGVLHAYLNLSLLLLIVGEMLFRASFVALLASQVFIALGYFPSIYQSPVLGVILSVDYIGFLVGILVTPRFMAAYGPQQTLWLSFGSSMVGVVSTSILCHLDVLAKAEEEDGEKREEEEEEKKKKARCASFAELSEFKLMFWVMAGALALNFAFSMIAVENRIVIGKDVGLYAAAVIVTGPLAGVFNVYFRLATAVAFLGATLSLTAFALVVGLVPVEPLIAVLIGIGHCAVFVSLIPIIPKFATQNRLGTATGVIVSSGSLCVFLVALVANCVKEELEDERKRKLGYLCLAVSVVVPILTAISFVVYCRQTWWGRRKGRGERLALLRKRKT